MPNHDTLPTYNQIVDQYDAGQQQPTVLTKRGNGDIVTAKLTAATDEYGRRFVEYNTAEGSAKKALAHDSLTDDFQEQLANELADSRIVSQAEVTQAIENPDDDVEITRKRISTGIARSAIDTSSWREVVIPIEDNSVEQQAANNAEAIDARAEVEAAIGDDLQESTVGPTDVAEVEVEQDDQQSPGSNGEKSDNGPSEGWKNILQMVHATMDSDNIRQLENTMRDGDISRESRALAMIEETRDELITLMQRVSGTDVLKPSESVGIEGVTSALRGPINIMNSEHQQLEKIYRLADQYDMRTPGMERAEDDLRNNIISGILHAKQRIDEAIQSQAKKAALEA